MAIFLGLLSLILAVGLAILLPILSWARMFRLERELGEMRARLKALEERDLERWAATRATEISVARATPAQEPVGSSAAPPSQAGVPVQHVAVTPAAPPVTPPEAETISSGTPVPALLAQSEPSTKEQHAPPAMAAEAEGLEEAIGGRLMLWVGTIVLVLGVAFFLKYAFDNEWITESLRVALGIVVGLGLSFGGDRFARRGYQVYGQVVTGGGIAALFLSIYAAFSYYGLIGQAPAFALMVAVTAAAAWLADRQRAVGLAAMAVGGGFATPFLVGSGVDAQFTLFTYDALLVCGTLFLASRHDWPVLNILSFAFTWLTIAGWAGTYYTSAKWIQTEVFLTVFCALFLGVLRAHVRHRGRDAVAIALGLGPILYHFCSIVILHQHGVALWVYFIAATVVAVAMAVRIESTSLRLASWVLVILPLMAWLDTHQTSRWLVPNLVSGVAVFALHAVAQLDIVFRQERRLGHADHALQHANGYALVLLVYFALENVALAAAPGATVGVGALHAVIAWTLRKVDRGAALHALAVAIGALTVALALRLDGPWFTVALGIEGLAVIVVGLQLAEPWFRLAGFALIGSAIVRYIALSLGATPVEFQLFRDQPFAIGAFLAAVFYLAAWRYRVSSMRGLREGRQGLLLSIVLGSVLLVVALSAENDVYWTLRGDTSADAGFARSLALSFIWMLCASAFIGVGMWRKFAPIRYLAMALFGVTVLKVFLVDLSALGGIYRILGFIGVGLVLLAVSFVYQRTRKPKRPEAPPEVASARPD